MKKTYLYAANVSPLYDDGAYMSAYSRLPESRRKRADAYKFKKDKALCVGAWLLAFRALSDFGVDINKETVFYGENKKPYIKGGAFFNVSHSGSFVICAVSPCEVGCDIEETGKPDIKIARRYFTEGENAALSCEKTQKDTFFRLWVLKESFMKATGEGMSMPLDSFEIVLGKEIKVLQNKFSKSFFFREYDISNGYKCAVCAENGEFEEKPVFVNL